MKLSIAVATLCLVAIGFSQGAQTQPTQKDKDRLTHLQSAYDHAKADYKKSPKDPSSRKKFVLAATAFGHESMMSPVLPARIKYRQALKIYREVLVLDPKNPVAKPESDLIIRIYKSMGREVPKD